MSFLIYKITNTVNNKIYVGLTEQTLEQRWHNHMVRLKRKIKNNYIIYNAMKKHGVENFSIELIEKCNSEEHMKQRETELIAELNTLPPNGYNMALGGSVNNMKSPIVYENHAKITRSKEWRERVSKQWKDVPKTDEQKKLYSEQKMGEKNPMYGKRPPNAKCIAMCDVLTDEILRVFETVKKANQFLHEKGIIKNPISNIDRSARRGHVSYGYRWKYVES